MSVTHVNIHEHHSCQSNIHEHHSCQSASKASFTKALASKASFTEFQLQSFTYKASVQGIQILSPNNRHFGPYMDSI
ncbi:hypothetical protein ACFX2A_000596 [Malus domestica]